MNIEFDRKRKKYKAIHVSGSGSIKHAPFDRAVYYFTRRFCFMWSPRLLWDEESKGNIVSPKGKRQIVMKAH